MYVSLKLLSHTSKILQLVEIVSSNVLVKMNFR